MKHLWLILLLLITPVQAGDDGEVIDDHLDYLNSLYENLHDHGSFYKAKVEIKDAIINSVKDNVEDELTRPVVTKILTDLQIKLLLMKATGVPIEHTLIGTFVNQDTALMSLEVTYKDAVSEITWEFQTVTDGETTAFFSRVKNGTAPESMDEYYRYELVTK
jgi:hypothetical protein